MEDDNPPFWSRQQLFGFAPDPYVIRQAEQQMLSDNWLGFYQNAGIFLWAEYARPKRDPIRVKVRLSDLTTHCSCGSRKNPCKFTIALLLRYQTDPASFQQSAPPSWLIAWQAELAQKQPKPPSPTQVSRRTAAVQAGMAEFGLWLKDRIDLGLATLIGNAHAIIQPMVHRLHDAHAGRLAHQLNNLNQRLFPKKKPPVTGWERELLAAFGRFYLFTQAWERYDQLSPAQQGDLQTAVSHTPRLPIAETIQDDWLVLGHQFILEGRRSFRRTTLLGQENGRFAQLSHALGTNAPLPNYPTNAVYSGDIHFPATTANTFAYLTNSAVWKPRLQTLFTIHNSQFTIHNFSSTLPQNPWQTHHPRLIQNAILHHQNGRFHLTTADGHTQPLAQTTRLDWHLLAQSGGQPITLFGEQTATQFDPLSFLSLAANAWLDLLPLGRIAPCS